MSKTTRYEIVMRDRDGSLWVARTYTKRGWAVKFMESIFHNSAFFIREVTL